MTMNIDKLKEALEYVGRNTDDDSELVTILENISLEHAKEIIEAARQYALIYPSLKVMMEAHERFKKASIEKQAASIDKPFSMRARRADDTYHSRKQELAITTANELTKIIEIMSTTPLDSGSCNQRGLPATGKDIEGGI